VAHDFGAGAATREKLQRVDHDGFAGTRFPSEHSQTRAPFDLDGIDDGEVTDLQ
jgi:hypothetical protein